MDSTVSSTTSDNNPKPTHYHEEVGTFDFYTGSKQYYDLIADRYGRDSHDSLRRTWMKAIVTKYKDWIGLTVTPKGNVKALDYCAGTGFMSYALSPYVNKIIGVDYSKNMMAQYAKIAVETLKEHLHCLMIAVPGDMVHSNLDPIRIPSDYLPFDIVAMSLGVYFLAPSATLHDNVPGLIQSLACLISFMAPGGTLLMLEIEKEYELSEQHEGEGEDPDNEANWQQSVRSNKKSGSYGSREICTALEALGMDDIEVKNDLWFIEPWKGGEIYFLLKARRGDKYRPPVFENVEE